MALRDDLLRRTAEAEEVARWAQHQTDAWDGTGGYAARFGEQAAANSQIIRPGVDSYLYQHEGELPKDYAARVYASRYDNLFRVVCEHWLGFLLAHPPCRDWSALPRQVQEWLEDVDGRGADIAEFVASGARWGLQYGVAPTLLTHTDAVTARMLYPQTLYAWDLDDDDRFRSLKIVTVTKQLDVLTSTTTDVYTVQILASDGSVYTVAQFTVTDGQSDVAAADTVTTRLDQIPLVMLRFSDPAPGKLLSFTPADALGQIARDMFNDTSRAWELRELLGTPSLAIPCARGQEETIAAIKIGPRNAIPVYEGQAASFMSPPQDCLQSHERSLDASRLAAYRVMGLETVLGATVSSVSGVSRQYAFAHLDAALRSYAQRLEVYERGMLTVAMRLMGFSEYQIDAAQDAYVLEWPNSFDVQDRMLELAEADAFLSLPGLDDVSRMAKLVEVRDRFVTLDDADLIAASDRELEAAVSLPDDAPAEEQPETGPEPTPEPPEEV